MTPEGVEALALALPAATLSVQWGDSRVYKVGGKMFAVIGLGGGLSVKVSDIAYEALLETGQARPAPYLARAGWVRFDDLSDLEPEETAHLLAQAHAMVAAKLTRALRRELQLSA